MTLKQPNAAQVLDTLVDAGVARSPLGCPRVVGQAGRRSSPRSGWPAAHRHVGGGRSARARLRIFGPTATAECVRLPADFFVNDLGGDLASLIGDLVLRMLTPTTIAGHAHRALAFPALSAFWVLITVIVGGLPLTSATSTGRSWPARDGDRLACAVLSICRPKSARTRAGFVGGRKGDGLVHPMFAVARSMKSSR